MTAINDNHRITVDRISVPRITVPRITVSVYQIGARDRRWPGAQAVPDPARGDGIADPAPVLERAADVAALLDGGGDANLPDALRRAESIGCWQLASIAFAVIGSCCIGAA
ncbi:hypothetical protein [Novosphingobium sp.]|uniref:hypothetical protein n=1 Tax=Novosphingobium sp. TaxID=1874826 RepID=UPI0027377AB7|nr:hypothetical protein [Novosphingobium sp.]MDP3908633.1 hypothetical protein [Novosphingobium sp.]